MCKCGVENVLLGLCMFMDVLLEMLIVMLYYGEWESGNK